MKISNVKLAISNSKLKGEEGFTLISAIVSTLILAIGVLSLVNLFPTSSLVNARADKINEAAILAEDLIETFRCAGYDSLVSFIDAGAGTGEHTIGKFTRRWTLTQVSNTIQVGVELEWQPPGRTLGHRKMNFVTLISKYE